MRFTRFQQSIACQQRGATETTETSHSLEKPTEKDAIKSSGIKSFYNSQNLLFRAVCEV